MNQKSNDEANVVRPNANALATSPRYQVTQRRRWRDDSGAERFHETVVIVRRFEGKRPEGRVWSNGDIYEFDSLISERDRPPHIWADRVETSKYIVATGRVPDDWIAI